MKTASLLVIAVLGAMGSRAVSAQETPRTMEHPAVTAERDAQLVTPAAKPPSWGPSLYPVPAEPDAARAKQSARADPALTTEKDSDSQRAPQQRRMPRRPVDQVLTPTPRITGSAPAASPALTYGPAFETKAPLSPPPPPRGTVPAICTGSGCTDANGQRLGTGVGNAVTTPQGQLCTKGVVGVQCF